jgi:hypothetical protein
MDARLDINDQRHLENSKRFDAIEGTLKELVATIAAAKGGVRILFAVGSVSAAVGAFFSSVFHYFSQHWK